MMFSKTIFAQTLAALLTICVCPQAAFTPLDLSGVFNEQHSDVWDSGDLPFNGHAYFESGPLDWFTEEQQVLDGIPFRLKILAFDALSGSEAGKESFEIPIDSEASAIFILGSANGSTLFTSDIGKFCLEIVYEDGDTEEQIPLNTVSLEPKWYDITSAQYAVAAFGSGPQWGLEAGQNTFLTRLFTYVLIPSQSKRIRSLYFHDNTRDTEFALFAVTLSDTLPERFIDVQDRIVRRMHPSDTFGGEVPSVTSGDYVLCDLSLLYNDEEDNAIDEGYGVDRGIQMASRQSVHIPERNPDDFTEGSWSEVFFCLPEPDLPDRNWNFGPWVGNWTLGSSSEHSTGSQSVVQSNPGWPVGLPVVFGIYSGEGRSWKTRSDTVLHFDMMMRSGDSGLQLMLFDASGNRRSLPLAGLAPTHSQQFTSLSFSLNEIPLAPGYTEFDYSQLTAVALCYEASNGHAYYIDNIYFETPYTPYFSTERVVFDDIPFKVLPDPSVSNCISSSVKDMERFAIPLHHRPSAIHLLISGYFDKDLPLDGEQSPDFVQRYDYFMTEIAYRDGVVERLFPYHPASGEYVVHGDRSLHRYVIRPTRDVIIDSITIEDGYDQGEFSLFGLTLETNGNQWAEPGPRRIRKVAAPAPSAPNTRWIGPGELVMENAHLRMTIEGLNNSKPLKIRSLTNKAIGEECLNTAGSIPFVLWRWHNQVGGGHDVFSPDQLTCDQVMVSSQTNSSTVWFKMFPAGTQDFDLDCSFSLELNHEALLDIRVNNLTASRINFAVFPLLSNVQIGASAQDDENFMPPFLGFLATGPIDYLSPYGAHVFVPLMDVSDPELGGGVYLHLGDPTSEAKNINMRKVGVEGRPIERVWGSRTGPLYQSGVLQSDSGLCIEMHYPFAPAGESWSMPQAHIGVHVGDWRTAWFSYRDWICDNLPRNPAPEALMDVMHYVHGHLTMQHDGDTYDLQTPDHVDLAHQYFGWWNFPGNPVVGNDDEYSYRTDWGGKNAFSLAIDKLHEKEQLVDFYLEGMLLHFQWGTWGTALTDTPDDDPTWTNSRASFLEIPAGNPFHGMCPGAPLWKDFLSATCARLVDDLDIDGVYIDSLTNNPPLPCFNPAHGHQTDYDYERNVVQIMRMIRQRMQAVKPDAYVTSESPHTDCVIAEMHGAYAYQRYGPSWDGDLWNLRPTAGLMHFLFPEKKFLVLPSQDFHIEELRIGAFYGDAVPEPWVLGAGPTILSPYRRHPNPFIVPIAQAMNRFKDQLTGEDSVPHLETERFGLRANRFSSSGLSPVYTLYNDNPYSLHGALLRIEETVDALYDHVSGNALPVIAMEEERFVSGTIHPGQLMLLSSETIPEEPSAVVQMHMY